jgi:hypothetical protein
LADLRYLFRIFHHQGPFDHASSVCNSASGILDFFCLVICILDYLHFDARILASVVSISYGKSVRYKDSHGLNWPGQPEKLSYDVTQVTH